MSRQTLPIIGAIVGGVVGFYATGGTPAGAAKGAQIGFMAGSVAGPIVDPLIIQGNVIGDNKLQVAAEGGARALMFGQGSVSATVVIARGNRTVTKTLQGGGKGGGGGVENESVYWTYAIGLGEAIPGGSILRVWQDEKLMYDVREESQMSAEDNADFIENVTFYDGSEYQLPDPALQLFLGADTPYFRGTAYVVFAYADLTSTAERIPLYRFEVSAEPGPQRILHAPLTTDREDKFAPAAIATEPSGSFYPIAYSQQGARFEYNSSTISYSTSITHKLSFIGDGTWTIQADIKFDFVSPAGTGDYIRFFIFGGGVSEAGFAFRVEAGSPVLYLYRYPGGILSIGKPVTSGRYKVVFTRTAGVEAVRWYLDDIMLQYELHQIPIANALHIGLYNGNRASFPALTYKDVKVVNGLTPKAGVFLPIALSTIVDALMSRAGMPPDSYDVTPLTDQVVGVVIQESLSAADAVTSITAAYFVDAAEYDTKLHFVRRGSPVLRTLTVDDLTEEPESSTRENVLEYSSKLHFFYQSPVTGYELTKATSARYSANVPVLSEGSVTVPVTFADASEPANIAAKLHKVMWAEAGGDFSWIVGDHCLDIVPTDCLGLSLRGVVTRARVTGVAIEQGKVKLTMRKDRQSAYTADVTAIPLPLPTAPLPGVPSLAVLAVLDIPALTDADDSLSYYTAASGSTQAWGGGQIQRSLDGGASWSTVGEATTAATMGRLTVAMDAASPNYPDMRGVVKVQLFDPDIQLDDLTDTQWLSEQGALAIEATSGVWEVIQYRDATDEGLGLFSLTVLQRGRLNTPAVAHGIGALVVVLSSGLQKQSAQSSWLGQTLQHRCVSYGTSQEAAAVVSATYLGRSQLEWPVASFVALSRGDVVNLSAITPRHRFGTEAIPVQSSNWSGYRVVCSDGVLFKTVDTTANSLTIDAVELGDITSVSVAQINRITGAGEALTVTPSQAPSLPQIYNITLGGTFQDGIGLRVSLGAEVFNHTTTVGDATLSGVAASLAALVDASTNFSAYATGSVVTVQGPDSLPFSAQLSIPGSGDGEMFAGIIDEASPPIPAAFYYGQLLLSNSTPNGNTDSIPSGSQFTVSVYRPAGTLVATVTCTTSSAQGASGVHSQIAAAFNASILGAQGYVYQSTYLGAQPIGALVGPGSLADIYVEATAPAPYQMGVSVVQAGGPGILPPGRAQKVRIQIDSLGANPATVGALYRATLAATQFDYTAISGDDVTDVVNALTALIDASPSYSAVAFSNYLEASSATANTAFAFSIEMISSTITLAGEIVQTAL